MNEVFDLGDAGSHYIPELGKHCWWDLGIALVNTEAHFVQRGGALEPIALRISGNDLKLFKDKKYKRCCWAMVLPKEGFRVEVGETSVLIYQEENILGTITGTNIKVQDFWEWGQG